MCWCLEEQMQKSEKCAGDDEYGVVPEADHMPAQATSMQINMTFQNSIHLIL